MINRIFLIIACAFILIGQFGLFSSCKKEISLDDVPLSHLVPEGVSGTIRLIQKNNYKDYDVRIQDLLGKKIRWEGKIINYFDNSYAAIELRDRNTVLIRCEKSYYDTHKLKDVIVTGVLFDFYNKTYPILNPYKIEFK